MNSAVQRTPRPHIIVGTQDKEGLKRDLENSGGLPELKSARAGTSRFRDVRATIRFVHLCQKTRQVIWELEGREVNRTLRELYLLKNIQF